MDRPKEHLLQSAAWAEVKKLQGQKVISVGKTNLFLKDTPKPLKPFGYLPQVNMGEVDWAEVFRTGQSQGLSHILVDPNDPVTETETLTRLKNQFQIVPAHSTQYRKTVVLDLTLSDEALLSKMHPKHRYNIRLAEKHGVEVEFRTDEEALTAFLDLFVATAKRKQYLGRNKEYYRKVWQVLRPLGKAVIALAKHEGQVLAAWMLLAHSGTLTYYYGGSSEEKRNLMPGHALVWAVIHWGRGQGYQKLDLGGLMSEDPKDPSYGLYRFKTGFSDEIFEYLPSFNLIINPSYYRLFKLAEKARNILISIKKKF